MSLSDGLFAIASCIGLIGLILCVIFGQVTVRKLRKNPETKGELGMEFYSGWDIFNVGLALTLPRKYARWSKKKGPFGMLRADVDLLYNHTTRFDRILARVFYIPCAFSAFSLLVLLLMDKIGFFKP
jgi:hypothetical protein